MSSHPPPAQHFERETPGDARRRRSAWLLRFFALSYLAVLVNTAGFLDSEQMVNAGTGSWLLSVYLTYGVFYLLPVWVPLELLNRVAARPGMDRWLRRPDALGLGLAVLGTTAVQVLLHADAVIYRIFGFHLNGFVWNLLATDGGIESMGASASTERSFALAVAAYLLLQVALAWVAGRLRWPPPPGWSRLPRPAALGLLWLLPVASVAERLAYSVSEQCGYRPVVTQGARFPFYMPLHWRGLGRALGLPDARDGSGWNTPDDARLAYPLEPLEPIPAEPRANILWLVAESLRADVLDAEIMPRTWAFAAGATRFTEHRSGSNGTRMGMFSMFYGLPGSYWFSFLEAHRGPLLVDALLAADYQPGLFTSARFSYPEFDRTIWSAVPSDALHERQKGLEGWENDRRNVELLLDFIDARDPQRPFLGFLFFESPHARYEFPDESIIRRPFLDDFDYAQLDETRDMPLVKNRYLNAVHHLDSQFGRLFDALAERGLLDTTIVVITGDHGEEFMEHGRWGHNSDFTEQQIRVPLVIHAPGAGPAVVDHLTSHLDLPATVLGLLGVHTPPAGWCLGHDLFGPDRRDDCLVADWDRLGLMAADAKIVLPVDQGLFAGPTVTTPGDEPVAVEIETALLDAHEERLLELGSELSRFRR